jgi:predicted GIY-YIG superfamily endonuclease
MRYFPYGFWKIKENCQKAALKCNGRTELSKKYSGAYNVACENGWMNEICSHMKPIGNSKKRMIYCAIFPDNHVYVGLTYNYEKRINDHLNSKKYSAIKTHILKTNLTPKFLRLTNYIPVDNAINEESEYVNFLSKFFVILNKTKTGGLGGNTYKWSHEKCEKIALKCKDKMDFRKKHPNVVMSAMRNGWYDNITSGYTTDRLFVYFIFNDDSLSKTYLHISDALKDGFTSSNIKLCVRGKIEKYKGFSWFRIPKNEYDKNKNYNNIKIFKK